jgi:hypothetical protein
VEQLAPAAPNVVGLDGDGKDRRFAAESFALADFGIAESIPQLEIAEDFRRHDIFAAKEALRLATWLYHGLALALIARLERNMRTKLRSRKQWRTVEYSDFLG